MQAPGSRGGTRSRLAEPDDWLGDVSEYDWSEHAAQHAERGRATPTRAGLVPVVDARERPRSQAADAAEARRAVVERRRFAAGLVVAVVLGVVIVAALMLLRGGGETPATEPSTTETPPAATTPSTTTETPTQETSTQPPPDTTPSTTTPATGGSSFTLPEGTKLRLGEGDPDVVRQLQQALIAAGFDPGSVDGSFGPRTEAAVTAFQQANGLSADGVVGPETASALAGALATG